jgi:hypothetical protein
MITIDYNAFHGMHQNGLSKNAVFPKKIELISKSI